MGPIKISRENGLLSIERYLKIPTVKMIASFKIPLNNDIQCYLYYQ